MSENRSRSHLHVITRILDLKIASILYSITESSSSGWSFGPSLPSGLVEAAASVVGNIMFLWGVGSPSTLAYDIQNKQWVSSKYPAKPLRGHHQAVITFEDRIYLVGSLGDNPGKITMYNPKDDRWTILETVIPNDVLGSVAAVVIDKLFYVCAGIMTGTSLKTSY
jgi:N-acetylneuraminic acid mutarotase